MRRGWRKHLIYKYSHLKEPVGEEQVDSTALTFPSHDSQAGIWSTLEVATNMFSRSLGSQKPCLRNQSANCEGWLFVPLLHPLKTKQGNKMNFKALMFLCVALWVKPEFAIGLEKLRWALQGKTKISFWTGEGVKQFYLRWHWKGKPHPSARLNPNGAGSHRGLSREVTWSDLCFQG